MLFTKAHFLWTRATVAGQTFWITLGVPLEGGWQLRTNNCALADIPVARRTAAERACLSLALLPWRPRKQTHKLSARANASGGWSFRSSRKTYLARWHQVKWPSASCVNQTGPTTTICYCWRFKAFWGQQYYTRVWERVHDSTSNPWGNSDHHHKIWREFSQDECQKWAWTHSLGYLLNCHQLLP